jgi:hypothetical protein
MDAVVFVRPPNVSDYDKLGKKEFSVVPRVDEFISLEVSAGRQYFQVIAVHHSISDTGSVEIYAVQSDPPWEVKKKRAIGFGS